MNIVPLLVSHAQAPLVEQPVECGFDYVAVLPKTAAMRRVAFGYQGQDPTLTQGFADLFLRIVCSVRQHDFRTSTRSTARAFYGRDRVHQWNGQVGVVDIRRCMLDGQWRTSSISNQMAFRTVFPTVGGIGAGLCPPKSARVEQLSIAAVDQSMPSAFPSSFRNRCQIFSHTPAMCQSRNRRQQVIPEPQPISCGRSSHWMPVRKTNRIPVSAARSGTRGRPPLGFGRSGGRSGSIRFHSSSVSSGLAMIMSSMTYIMHRPDYRSRNRFC